MADASQRIITIIREGKEQQKPYPQVFAELKKAGVTEYTTSYQQEYTSIYKGTFGECHEPTLPGFSPVTVEPLFSQDAIEKALSARQQKKLTFVDFLHALGAAGVSHHRANMENHTVTYYNPTETEMYIQKIPIL